MQVCCDHHLHGLPGSEFDVSNMFSKSHVENTSSPFFSNTFTEAYGANAMRFFLTRNRQYLGLESNLSSEFILNPRIPFAQDILIANENLDGSLAALFVLISQLEIFQYLEIKICLTAMFCMRLRFKDSFPKSKI